MKTKLPCVFVDNKTKPAIPPASVSSRTFKDAKGESGSDIYQI
jgi:hypothetical protein